MRRWARLSAAVIPGLLVVVADGAENVDAMQSTRPAAARNLRALSNCALDLDNHKHGCERPSSAERNSHPGPGVRNIDFRVTRDVPVHDGMHFEFIAEAFNLMNHTIISSVNTAFATQLAPTAPARGPQFLPDRSSHDASCRLSPARSREHLE